MISLIELRRRAGLTREQLAVAAGVSLATIQRWETGTTQPVLDDLRKLRTILGDGVMDLLKEVG